MQRRIYIEILTTEPLSMSNISYCAIGITIYLMQELLDSLGLLDFFIEGRVTDKHAVRSDNVSVDASCKCDYNVPFMMKFS